jgi:hypothetical protein
VAARIVYSPPDLEGMPGPLREVVMTAMEKDPAARPTPAQLLQMLGVSGADPALAVRTRLEGLGLAGPSAPPPDRTRTDFSTLAFPSPPPPANDVSLRFGPGIPADEQILPPVTQTWRTGQAPKLPRRRRRGWIRSLVSSLISIGIIIGVVAWLLLRNQSSADLAVTGLDVQVDKAKQTCGANVDITAAVTTNGAAGQLVYQWQRSDEQQPEAQRQQTVPDGQKSIALHLIWQISGYAVAKPFTATLTVLNTPSIQKTASFTYTCRTQ